MSRIPVNHDLVKQYREMRNSINRGRPYSTGSEEDEEDTTNRSFEENCNYDSTLNTCGTMADCLASPVAQKPKRVSLTLDQHKQRSTTAVDRSLRSQGWVGGSTPVSSPGYKKPKRSWKLKNPSDEMYVNLGSSNHT